MPKGFPDYQDWSSRGSVGEDMISYSFVGNVDSETQGYFDLPAVPEGYEHVYQCITVSCPDDTAIHDVTLRRISDTWVFFSTYFITGGIFDFPGQAITAGEQVRVLITNNSAGTLYFEEAVNYVIKKV